MFGQNTWFINPQNKAELFRTYQPEGSEFFSTLTRQNRSRSIIVPPLKRTNYEQIVLHENYAEEVFK